MSNIQGVLTTEEAAELLGCHPSNIFRVPGIDRVMRQKVGKAWAWHEGDIVALSKSFVSRDQQCAMMINPPGWGTSQRCRRNAGHGEDGAYCWQHAAAASQAGEYAEEVTITLSDKMIDATIARFQRAHTAASTKVLRQLMKKLPLKPEMVSVTFADLLSDHFVLMLESVESGRENTEEEVEIPLPTINEAIQFRIDQLNVSRGMFAKMIGMWPENLNQVLKGEAHLSLAATKKAYALGVPAKVLLQEEGGEDG